MTQDGEAACVTMPDGSCVAEGVCMHGGAPPTLENATKWVVDYVRHNFRPRFDITQQDEDGLLETLRESYVGDVVRAALGRSVPQEPPPVTDEDVRTFAHAATHGELRQALEWFAAKVGAGRSVPAEPTPLLAQNARSAIEAAQEVIGQCDCIMSEMADGDPKRLWREARDRYYAALGAPPQGEPPTAEYDSAPSLGKITSMDEFLHGSAPGEPPTP